MREIVRLFSFLRRVSGGVPHSPLRIAFIALAGIASGLATTGMIALINGIVARHVIFSRAALWGFATLCIILPACRFFSQLLLMDLSHDSLLALRLRLSNQVLRAPLRQLEEIGAPRLLATLTNDIGTIIDAMGMIPVLLMHASLVVSGFVYLGWLNWRLLLEVALYVVIGVITYQFAERRAVLHFQRSRQYLNEVFGQIRSMVEGTKELKMHRRRRRAFLDSIERSTVALQTENRAGQVVSGISSSLGQVLFFILIGTIVLVLPRFQALNSTTLIGYTIVLFQMMAPLEVLLTAFPTLARATVSVATVEELGLSLQSEVPCSKQSEVPTGGKGELLELTEVRHAYRGDGESFLLGPIDLTFRQGELVFVVGGNGSGKTTFAKLLLGLYTPESGKIRFAGEPVTDANRDLYRERFSVVFSDFFVFERLLGLDGADLDENARRYLTRLQLDRKVRVDQGALSTVELSQGQRKRLALLTAYLEDRPIYLFDEWAADQDPTFKRIFYLELLPELKRRGKTVFVISHDDHYFHVADRILKLDYGKIESDRYGDELRQDLRPLRSELGRAAGPGT